MRDVLPALVRTLAGGARAGLATVVRTSGSAPRPAGASLLVAEDGGVTGSVSAGCVEGEVYDLCRGVLDAEPVTLRRYGISDDDAFAVGLTCGGVIDVFVDRWEPADLPRLERLGRAAGVREALAHATVVVGPPGALGARVTVGPDGDGEGTTGGAALDAAIRADAADLLRTGRSELLFYDEQGRRPGRAFGVFVESFAPAPRLLVFGTGEFAVTLARLGGFLGHRVTVCDARAAFTTAARFPEAEQVVVDWPHRYLRAEAAAGRIDGRTAVCVLTHDPKFDVPLLEVALRLPDLGYLGVMGSRDSQRDRHARLREAGLTPLELRRMSGPLGLDIGAVTPEETAVSIVAEMIAAAHGRDGKPLARARGPIHTVADAPREQRRRA